MLLNDVVFLLFQKCTKLNGFKFDFSKKLWEGADRSQMIVQIDTNHYWPQIPY